MQTSINMFPSFVSGIHLDINFDIFSSMIESVPIVTIVITTISTIVISPFIAIVLIRSVRTSIIPEPSVSLRNVTSRLIAHVTSRWIYTIIDEIKRLLKLKYCIDALIVNLHASLLSGNTLPSVSCSIMNAMISSANGTIVAAIIQCFRD